ncbi:MAG: HAD hydrolase-like protein [Patescibacteria group bacterium]|nr:HAD hydrolase-like protein [Patescibacteria group bacterium]
MRIPIFDIDDTLLPTRNPAHVGALVLACNAICGTSVTAADFQRSVPGMIDPQIVAMLLRAQGLSDAQITPCLPRILATMVDHFDQHAAEHPGHYVPLPGVVETLRQLGDYGIPAGVLTGNIERIGWRKLELAGLRAYFSFGAFSDKAEHRAQLVPIAYRRVQALGVHEPALVIVGDSTRDIACAKEACIVGVGVASGESTVAELTAAGADLVISSLQEHRRFLEFLQR